MTRPGRARRRAGNPRDYRPGGMGLGREPGRGGPMLDVHGDFRCCDRCTGNATAVRASRRRMLKAAVLTTHDGPSRPEADQAADFPAPGKLPRAVTGTVRDVSPHVLVIGNGASETPDRAHLRRDGLAWRPAGPVRGAARRPGRGPAASFAAQRGRPDLGEHRPRDRHHHRARRGQPAGRRGQDEAAPVSDDPGCRVWPDPGPLPEPRARLPASTSSACGGPANSRHGYQRRPSPLTRSTRCPRRRW